MFHFALDVEEWSLLSQRIFCRNFVAGLLRLFVLISTVHFPTEDPQLCVPDVLCVLFPI